VTAAVLPQNQTAPPWLAKVGAVVSAKGWLRILRRRRVTCRRWVTRQC